MIVAAPDAARRSGPTLLASTGFPPSSELFSRVGVRVDHFTGFVLRGRQDRDRRRSAELLDVVSLDAVILHPDRSRLGPFTRRAREPMSPSIVWNGCECRYSASLSSSRVFAAAIASSRICNSLYANGGKKWPSRATPSAGALAWYFLKKSMTHCRGRLRH